MESPTRLASSCAGRLRLSSGAPLGLRYEHAPVHGVSRSSRGDRTRTPDPDHATGRSRGRTPYSHLPAPRDVDAGLRRPRHPRQVQQGRGHKGRTERCQERPGPGAGYLGRRRLLRAARQVDRLQDQGWQVWAVERRENLLEDQSELNLYKEHKATTTQLFDYYLGYLKNPSITHHYQPVANSTVEFAKQWGMNVAVQDLHVVIGAAKKLGGKVVLGGHSLGGSVVTAYATWDFDGHAGADELAAWSTSMAAAPRPR